MNLLLIASRLVFAAKVDDLKRKNPEFSNELDELNSKDPSKKGKYLEWSLKQLKSGGKLEDIIPTVELFHNRQQSLSKKDINQYTLKELENELKNLSPSKTQKKKDTKLSGSQKIYEDDQYLFMRMDSKEACITYGSGTKWCITMSSDMYYEDYAKDGAKHYFLIDKTKDKSDVFKRVAITITPYIGNFKLKNPKVKVIDDFAVDMRDESDNKLTDYDGFNKFINLAIKDYPSAPLSKEYDVTKNPENYLDPEYRDIVYISLKNIDPNKLHLLANHSDDDIRSFVVANIDPKYFPQMINDPNDNIRRRVAEGIDPEYLPRMINDQNKRVRAEVADRIDPKYLPEMMNDEYGYIRRSVAQRIDPKYLPEMMNDNDAMVRTEVARRIDPKYLHQMMNDEYPYVRNIIEKRMKEYDIRTSSELFWENYNF